MATRPKRPSEAIQKDQKPDGVISLNRGKPDYESSRLMSFPDAALLPILVGDHERHLARIESAFSIRVSYRKSQILLFGDSHGVESAEIALLSLYESLKNGEFINLKTVDSVIRNSQHDVEAPSKENVWEVGEAAAEQQVTEQAEQEHLRDEMQYWADEVAAADQQAAEESRISKKPSIYERFNALAASERARSSTELRSEPYLDISLKEPNFHYCLQYKGRRVFVWTYKFEAKNVGNSLIHLRSRKLAINEPSILLLLRHGSHGQLTLWGEQPYIRPGEALVFTPGIAFDGKTGTINAGWIDGYRTDTFEEIRFDVNTSHATFDIQNAVRFDVIDIDQLGQNGKISLNSAKAFLDYLEEKKNELNAPGRVQSNIAIDFSTIPGVSFQDTFLLCNYLICLGRENHDKERKFDFGPVLPEGISAEISSVDHFMKPTNHTETDIAGTKGSAVGVTIVASAITYSTYSPEKEKRIQHLIAYCEAANMPESERPAFIEKCEIDLARAIRPKWVGRQERGGELATLSAPLFLKRVHAEDISPDGTVENETIRAIDPDLMGAVETYLAQRRSYAKKSKLPLDLKDAKGLTFVLARPSAKPQDTLEEEPSP